MASNILASVSVVLGAEVSEFKAKMAEARRELSGLLKFGEGAKDVGESLSKYVTLPLLALGGAGVKMAGDLEKATASFTTLLGSAEAAQQTLGELKAFAADTPFEFPEIQDAAKKLLAFNTPAKDLKETLRQLGDISAGIDAPIGEIAELFGKARVQGRLFQEDINQLTGRGIPIIQELAKQFNVSEAGVRKLVESGKVNFGNLQTAFADLTKEGGKFGGLMEKQSQTLPGLFSTLKDNVGQAVAGIGTDLVAALDLKGVVRQIGDFVQAAANAFAGLSPEVKKAIFVAAGLAAALGPVLVAAGGLITALPALQAGFAVLGVSSVAALGPLLVPIGAIAAGAVLIYENWSQLRPVFADAAAAIGTAIGQIKDIFSGLDVGSTFGDLVKGLNLTQKLVTEIGVGVRALADIFGGTVGAIAALLRGDFKAALSEAGRAVVGLASPLANLLGFSKKATFDDFFHLRDAVIAADEAALQGAVSGGDLAKALDDERKAAAAATALTEEQVKALQKLQEALRLNERLSLALGDSYGFLQGKQSALESGIKSLVAAGFDPAGRTVQRYVAQLKELNQVLGDNARVSARTVLKAPETPEFKLNAAPGFDKLPTTLIDFRGVPAQLKEQFNPIYGALAEFNTRAGEIIGSGLGALVSQFVSGLSGLAAGSTTLEQLGGQLLGIIGQIATQLGEAVIAIGIGMLNLKTAFTNPLSAIAAGAALLVVGGALSAIASSAVNGGPATGGGGGGGNYGQAPPVQQTVKVVAEFKLRGEDLVASGKLGAYRQSRTA